MSNELIDQIRQAQEDGRILCPKYHSKLLDAITEQHGIGLSGGWHTVYEDYFHSNNDSHLRGRTMDEVLRTGVFLEDGVNYEIYIGVVDGFSQRPPALNGIVPYFARLNADGEINFPIHNSRFSEGTFNVCCIATMYLSFRIEILDYLGSQPPQIRAYHQVPGFFGLLGFTMIGQLGGHVSSMGADIIDLYMAQHIHNGANLYDNNVGGTELVFAHQSSSLNSVTEDVTYKIVVKKRYDDVNSPTLKDSISNDINNALQMGSDNKLFVEKEVPFNVWEIECAWTDDLKYIVTSRGHEYQICCHVDIFPQGMELIKGRVHTVINTESLIAQGYPRLAEALNDLIKPIKSIPVTYFGLEEDGNPPRRQISHGHATIDNGQVRVVVYEDIVFSRFYIAFETVLYSNVPSIPGQL